jgi:hypothetical protein
MKEQSLMYASVLVTAWLVGPILGVADEPPKSPATETTPLVQPTAQGGSLVKTARHQFEVYFYATGLRVFPRTGAGTAVVVSKLSGTVSLALAGVAKPYVYTLQGAAPSGGREAESIDLGVDLSRVPAAGTTATFKIDGLADPAETGAAFTVPFRLVGAPASTVVTRPANTAVTVVRASQADQAAINAQRVCPVSGQALGSMGGPIKVIRGNRAIYLCCGSCVRTVQANPDRYFGPGQ